MAAFFRERRLCGIRRAPIVQSCQAWLQRARFAVRIQPSNSGMVNALAGDVDGLGCVVAGVGGMPTESYVAEP